MRNRVGTLLGASSGSVEVLKLSMNKISSLAGLEGFPNLTELWLNANDLRSPGELQRLTACGRLRVLALRPNPGLDGLPEATYRGLVLNQCPELSMLDGKPVTEDDKKAARLAPDPATLDAAPAEEPAGAADAPLAAASALAAKASREAELIARMSANQAEIEGLKKSSFRREPAAGPGPRGPAPAYGRVRSKVDSGARAGPRKAAEIEVPEGVGALELVQGLLPQLSDPSTKGPPRTARDPKLRSSAIVTDEMNPRAHECVYEAKYEGESAGNRAVAVMGDGSAMAKYPDDAVAVTVSSAVRRGVVVFQAMGFYRSGNVAFAFDADGSGCAQHPGGQIMLTYSADTGAGMVFGREGDIVRTLPEAGGGDALDLPLDAGLGLRLDLSGGGRHAIYFAAGSVRHMLVRGANAAEATWDDAASFAGKMARGAKASVRVARPHEGKAPVNRTLSGRVSDIASSGAAIAHLGSDLAAKMAKLRAMDADAGITYGGGGGESRDDWRKDLQGASGLSLKPEEGTPGKAEGAGGGGGQAPPAGLPRMGALPSEGA